MAKLYISEFRFMGSNSYGESQMSREGSGTVHQTPVDFSGGEDQSAAFADTTQYVEIWADSDCLYAVGTDPDASTGGTPLTAKTSKAFGVTAGNKISVAPLA